MIAVICLDPLYPNLLTEDKIPRIAAAGFRHVEFWGWREKNISAIQEACREYQVQVVNFSGHRVGSPVAEKTHAALFADVTDAISTARALNCQTLMFLTNELNSDGSVANRYEEIPDGIKFSNTVRALKQLVSSVPADMNLILEPLNTLVDHAGYYLDKIDTAVAIVREVGSPRLKILCDLYHFGIMGSDLKEIVTAHLPEIGHFHIADFPGRHEPGTGSFDWASMLRHIQALGYSGGVGFEYFPKSDSDLSLQAIRELWKAGVGD
ncbi:MAG: TIM barrel protein [Terrimicrobiaceae bacterium]